MTTTGKKALIAIGLLLSAVFLWLALRDVDGRELWSALGSAEPLWLVPFLMCLAAFCWLKAVRWALLLSPARKTRARELIGPVIIGYMGTGLMPMQLGEVTRAYVAATMVRTRMAAILASLIVERILDVFVLLLILALVGALGTDLGAKYRMFGVGFAALAGLACSALWIYAAYPERFIAIVARCSRALPAALRDRITDQLHAGAAGLQVLRQPGLYLKLASLSIAQWSFMCLCTWISLAAIGQFTPPAAALAVLATTIVSMTLPSGPGYVGVLQLAYVIALAPFDVERNDALAASFVYLTALWVPLVACGMVLLHRFGFRLRTMADMESHRTANERPVD